MGLESGFIAFFRVNSFFKSTHCILKIKIQTHSRQETLKTDVLNVLVIGENGRFYFYR